MAFLMPVPLSFPYYVLRTPSGLHLQDTGKVLKPLRVPITVIPLYLILPNFLPSSPTKPDLRF